MPRTDASSRSTRWSIVPRVFALGVAAGSRSTLAVAAPTLAPRPGPAAPPPRAATARAAAVLAVAGEIAGDKRPEAPSRLAGPGAAVRVAAGAVGGVLLARRRATGTAPAAAAALAGAAGAAAGAYGGAAWRGLAVGRRPDWPGAVAEDVVAVSLAAWAVRR
jgi:uncharacterized membrane protein